MHVDQHETETWRALEADVRRVVSRRLSPRSSADADDIVQDVLMRIGRLEESGRDLGPGYVHRVAVNAVIDHQRAMSRTVKKRAEVGAAEEVELLDDPEREILESLIDCLPAFLSQLSAPDREALRLVYLEGAAQTDAADALGVSVSGMKSRVQRSRARLRALYDACCAIALDARSAPITCYPKMQRSCCAKA